MRKMMKLMKEHLEKGEALVLVTVIASDGAAPRGAGARMLIGREGRLSGTIGGGAVEYRSEQIAAEVLKTGDSGSHDFSLTRNDVEDLGMICGGAVKVYFSYIPAGDPTYLALAEETEQKFAEGKDLWLVADVTEGSTMFLADKSNKKLARELTRHPHRTTLEGRELYIEQINTSGRVYIFGGGHVAQELEPVLTHVGFRCVVMDDRPEFANRDLFPTAEEVLMVDFEKISDYIHIGPQDYVCVMTRGHGFDTVVQAQVLPMHPCYCGGIGSRHKAAGVRKTLHDDYGLSDADLDQVTTPIGLAIQAETPAEIAISIAGELISFRADLNKQ